MKTIKKISYLVFSFLMLGMYNGLKALSPGWDAVNFAVTQNPFSGRSRGALMNFVTSTWKGLNVVRGKPLEVSDPESPGQLLQRGKFSLVQHAASQLLAIIQVGFKNLAIHMSEYNVAIQKNLTAAITAPGGVPQLNIEDLLLSLGSLESIDTPVVAQAPNASIQLTWTDNSGTGNALATDKLYMAITSDIATKVKLIQGSVTRDAESAIAACPPSFEGDDIHVFAFFVSADGSIVSDTTYCGTETVPNII